MKLYPHPSEWHMLYFAVGHNSGNVQVFSYDHKISFNTQRMKSNVLSVAFSLQVRISRVCMVTIMHSSLEETGVHWMKTYPRA